MAFDCDNIWKLASDTRAHFHGGRERTDNLRFNARSNDHGIKAIGLVYHKPIACATKRHRQ